MDWLIGAGVTALLVAAGMLAQRKGWIDMTGKHAGGRGGGVAGLVGGADEVFAPTRHEAQRELEREHSLPGPAPVPGDGADWALGSGRIRIQLPQRDPEHRER